MKFRKMLAPKTDNDIISTEQADLDAKKDIVLKLDDNSEILAPNTE